MPPHSVSRDIKARIPVLRYELGFSVKDICRVLGIKKSLVYKTLQFYHAHGTTYNPHARRQAQRHQLSSIDVSFIRALLSQDHTIYLDEIQEQLLVRRNVHVSVPTLTRTLRRLHFTNKGVSGRAYERNDQLRAVFMNNIADIVTNPDMLMFGDEAAKNERTTARRRGWSVQGSRCVQRKVFVRGRRFSILPILTLDGIIAYDIIEGSVTSDRFLQFLRELVVSFHLICIQIFSTLICLQLPLTNPYPGPRSVLILDNCQIHHSEEIRQLVEDEARKLQSSNYANFTEHASYQIAS